MELPKPILYVKQMGAGCGKTYASVNTILARDARFNKKQLFIYLSKLNSATHTIFQKFSELLGCTCYNRGEFILDNTCPARTSDKIVVGDAFNDIITHADAPWFETNGRQRTLYLHKRGVGDIKVVIGTIDSFGFSVGSVLQNISNIEYKVKADYFVGLQKYISSTGEHCGEIPRHVRYAGNTLTIDEQCLILIDEAQDLVDEYLTATTVILKYTAADAYMIGDRLQSVYGADNAMCNYGRGELKERVWIAEETGVNIVRRFHNAAHMPFVNGAIDFEKHGLPKIEGICAEDKSTRGCKHEHINEAPIRFTLDINAEVAIKNIIDMVKGEVDARGYAPRDFMFIFPILSQNDFAAMLESYLQVFWAERLGAEQRYVRLHKYEKNSSINLGESEGMSRILTIHSSKGIGCKIVFLLDISDNKLFCFSRGKRDVVFDSLVHVAITRQERTLYIGTLGNPGVHTENMLGIAFDNGLHHLGRVHGKVTVDGFREHFMNIFNDDNFLEIFDANESIGAMQQEIDDSSNPERAPMHGVSTILMRSAMFVKTAVFFWSKTKSSAAQIQIVLDHLRNSNVRIFSLDHACCPHTEKCACRAFALFNRHSPQSTRIYSKESCHTHMGDITKCTAENMRNYYDAMNKIRIKACNYENKELADVCLLQYSGRRARDAIDVILKIMRHTKSKLTRLRDEIALLGADAQQIDFCPMEATVLSFLIYARTGDYRKISQITMNEIINDYMFYVKNMDDDDAAAHTKMYKCACVKLAAAGQYDRCANPGAIRTFMSAHALDMITVESRLNEMKSVISGDDLAININHYLYASDGIFSLGCNLLPFILHTKTDVYLLHLHPEISNLNKRDVHADVLVCNFLITSKHCSTSNKERYCGKTIQHIIITPGFSAITRVTIPNYDQFSVYHAIDANIGSAMIKTLRAHHHIICGAYVHILRAGADDPIGRIMNCIQSAHTQHVVCALLAFKREHKTMTDRDVAALYKLLESELTNGVKKFIEF